MKAELVKLLVKTGEVESASAISRKYVSVQ